MLTDFVISLIQFIDNIVSGLSLFDLLNELVVKMNTYQSYINEFQVYLSGAFYVFGKPLIIFVLGASATVFIIKLVMAIVMIVGQFVP